MKYEFTGKTKVVDGVTLRRIRAATAFGIVIKGEVGGWIESEHKEIERMLERKLPKKGRR